MDPTDAVERRLTELEIKAGFAEDLLDSLNALVARQQETIETLVREVARLRQVHAAGPEAPTTGLRDELPPHY
jgi:SlyX protein